MPKVFQGSVGQFISAPLMILGKNMMSWQKMTLVSLTELFVNFATHSEVRDDDAILDQARQSQLRAMLDQAAIDGSAGFVPPTLSGFEFSILPDRSFILGKEKVCQSVANPAAFMTLG